LVTVNKVPKVLPLIPMIMKHLKRGSDKPMRDLCPKLPEILETETQSVH
jgi:hypothetical protein